ncbi:unnamed protein product [Brachionus calyciflorus]|uniref:Uncharacterized protein n=1 Tax=Brachionus calyciflorus TaxID=104777 RepID=A0A814IPV1_9BILA|nr:unnamed protein product [Brachionus calyciflorus]
MLSIYLLKINGVSLTIPKVCLCLICVLICILPLLLPEQTTLTFNLAEQEQQNEVGTNNTTLQKRSRFSTLDSNKFILNINEMKSELKLSYYLLP